jgi:hypothetical protein
MPFDDSHTTPKTAEDRAVEAEKRRRIAAYQAGAKEPCFCHCHLAMGCGCRKGCEHCGGDEMQTGRSAEAPRPVEAPT